MPEPAPHRRPAPAARGRGTPGAVSGSATPALPDRVLAFQRAAGNAAVARLLGSRTTLPRARLARFAAGEHVRLGNTTGTNVDLGNGVVLTWGEIVALAGDEYGSLEELLADAKTDEGKARLRAALERAEIPGAIAARLPPPTEDQRKAQGTKYIQLAMGNVTHFPDGGEALRAWGGHHAAAVEQAVMAGLANDPAGMALAYANEAFGQHFLTDCFSGGHIRTPRRAIVDFYVGTFAPRVAGPMIARLRTRVIESLVREASPQTGAPDDLLRSKIAPRVNAQVDAAIAAVGGIGKLTELIGLGIAGAISGAMHDQEGKTGVMVASDDHPEPWRAYGDNELSKSPVSEQQATKAIAEAKAQVDAAFLAGQEAGAARDTVAAGDPPTRVHFAFASSALQGAAAAAVETAATYMTFRPNAVLEISGHTDPVGTDAANMALGQARADAVAAALRSRGVDAGRVRTRSMGEGVLLTRNPREYARNRRADFAWATGPPAGGGNGAGPTDQERAAQMAMAKAQERADTARVTRFVPRPVEERAQQSAPGGNAELPEWHWGRLAPPFRTAIDAWIRAHVGTKLDDAVGSVEEVVTETVPVTGTQVTVHPRDRAREIVRALMAAPTAQLGELAGEPPGP